MTQIHPSSIVADTAKLGQNVSIGPFCIIGDGVAVGDDCMLASHVVLEPGVELGSNNKIYNFVRLGGAAQDLQHSSDGCKLLIGERNIIREHCTINLGTQGGKGRTELGHDNYLMTGVHIGHDCQVGNHNVITNNCALAGHVQLGNYVTLGGGVLVHQFCRIGDYVFIGRCGPTAQDVPPYLKCSGTNKTKVYGLNHPALKKSSWNKEQLAALKEVYRIFYRENKVIKEALANEKMQKLYADFAEVRRFVDFIRDSERGITS